MDLWIRSQDKMNLVKVNTLWIMGNQIWMEVPFYENHKKLGLTVTGHNHKLAEYETEKRALEVLDEIQKILMPKIQVTSEFKKSDLTGNCNWIDKKEIMQFNTYVYQMPKE